MQNKHGLLFILVSAQQPVTPNVCCKQGQRLNDSPSLRLKIVPTKIKLGITVGGAFHGLELYLL